MMLCKKLIISILCHICIQVHANVSSIVCDQITSTYVEPRQGNNILWRCADERCIAAAERCDGIVNCEDASDEEQCPRSAQFGSPSLYINGQVEEKFGVGHWKCWQHIFHIKGLLQLATWQDYHPAQSCCPNLHSTDFPSNERIQI